MNSPGRIIMVQKYALLLVDLGRFIYVLWTTEYTTALVTLNVVKSMSACASTRRTCVSISAHMTNCFYTPFTQSGCCLPGAHASQPMTSLHAVPLGHCWHSVNITCVLYIAIYQCTMFCFRRVARMIIGTEWNVFNKTLHDCIF